MDAKSQGTPISSGIYGVAFNSDDSMNVAGLNRWGGDETSSYNWKNSIANAGNDWNCANYQQKFTTPNPDSSLTSATDQFVHYNVTQKVDTLMTIPITGWVASATSTGGSMTDCSATTTSPSAACCAGASTQIPACCKTLGVTEEELVDKGSSVLDTSYMGGWVTHLVSTFGSAANGGVKYYQLDNEPDNWQGLRQDIYPSLYPPGTNCEAFYSTNTAIGTSLNQDFINRTMAYSKAIKSADPTAKVLFMSTENAWDLVAIPNNECGNPSGPYSVTSSLTMYLLQQAAAAEAANHVRLLDCVDMHYPFTGKGLGDSAALWDPTVTQYGATVIPPHVQGWINSTYPGTAICVSEYTVQNDGQSSGSADASSGAQLADVLGMYGRLGYMAAAYWTDLVHTTGTTQTHLPIYNAMAMYRNYDGSGAHFGSYSIGAASPNAGVNVYAASDSPSNPTKVWIMLVNVSTAAQSGLSITLQNFTAGSTAQVYSMNGGAAPTSGTAIAVANGSISGVSVPVNSATLLVLSH